MVGGLVLVIIIIISIVTVVVMRQRMRRCGRYCGGDHIGMIVMTTISIITIASTTSTGIKCTPAMLWYFSHHHLAFNVAHTGVLGWLAGVYVRRVVKEERVRPARKQEGDVEYRYDGSLNDRSDINNFKTSKLLLNCLLLVLVLARVEEEGISLS